MKPTHLTPSQSAKLLEMSRPAFLKHVKAGRIRARIVTEGNRALFARADVVAFKKLWSASKNGRKQPNSPNGVKRKVK